MDEYSEPAQVDDVAPTPAPGAAAPEPTAVPAPTGVPEPGPIPDDQARREVAADAEYHAARAATPAPQASAPAAAPVETATPAASASAAAPAETTTPPAGSTVPPDGAADTLATDVATAPTAADVATAPTAVPETPAVPTPAASSTYKRLVPVGVAVVVVAAVVIWLAVR